MPKKEKIPQPGGKKDEFTNFMSKGKWKAALLKTGLDIAGRSLRPTGSKIVSNALMKMKNHVVQLDFSHNHMGDEGAIEVAQVLKVSELLHTVNLSVNEITDIGAVAIAAAFVPCANPTGMPSQWNRSVNYLLLACNKISDDGFVALANAAACHHDMAKIDLARNAIGGFGIRALMRSQERNRMCQFALHGNQLGNEGVQHLCAAWKAFGGKGSHAVLNLHENDFSLGGAQGLGDLLDGNDFLQDINVSCNTLGSRGAEALSSKMVPAGRNVVRFINLANNRLRDEGAEEIAKILEANSEHLTKLNLSYNQIDDKGGERLCHALAKSFAMVNFIASHNQFRDRTVEAFCSMLPANKSIKVVDIKGNNFTEPQKMRLGEAMKACPSAGFRMDYGAVDDTLSMKDFLDKLSQYMQMLAEEEAKKAAKKKKKKTRSASNSPGTSARSPARSVVGNSAR